MFAPQEDETKAAIAASAVDIALTRVDTTGTEIVPLWVAFRSWLLLRTIARAACRRPRLERCAEEMRRDGWDRARVLRLPYEEHGYWWTQRRSMERLLETVPFVPGQSILDIGATTCWATFAHIGLRAVALDISMVELQGLRTADWWLEDQGTYFERVLAQMSAPPFADVSRRLPKARVLDSAAPLSVRN